MDTPTKQNTLTGTSTVGTPKDKVILEGDVWVHNIFGFTKRTCKIYRDRIKIGNTLKERFDLNFACKISDSTRRAFCITITNPATLKVLHIAMDTYFEKDEWTAALRNVIVHLQRAQVTKTSHKPADMVDSVEFSDPSCLYVKVMSVRNLFTSIGLDVEQVDELNVYVDVVVGNSSVRTVSRPANSKTDPEWGMMFHFDQWDNTVRYVKVEVCSEQPLTNLRSNVLGVAQIPVYSLYQHPGSDATATWYPLMRLEAKSNRSMFAISDIKVELSTNDNYPDDEQLGWQFMIEAQRLSDLRIPLLSTEQGDMERIMRNIDKALVKDNIPSSGSDPNDNGDGDGDGDGVDASTGNSNDSSPSQTPRKGETSSHHKSKPHVDLATKMDRKIVTEVKCLLEAFHDQPAVEAALADMHQRVTVSQGKTTTTLASSSPAEGVVSEVSEAASTETAATAEAAAVIDGVEDTETILDRHTCFPFSFPTVELEQLEDLSLCVSLLNKAEKSEVAIRGVVLLTNYRLIFLSTARIFVPDGPVWENFKQYDVSTFVPIEQIVRVEKPEREQVIGAAGEPRHSKYYLTIRTTDNRNLHFQFHERRVPWAVLKKQSEDTIRRSLDLDSSVTFHGEHHRHNQHHLYHHHRHHFHAGDTALSTILGKFYEESADFVEAPDSAEGPPVIRMYNRLRLRSINRFTEHRWIMDLHSSLFKRIRTSCASVPDLTYLERSPAIGDEIFNMDDEERFNLFRAPSSNTPRRMKEEERDSKNALKARALSPSRIPDSLIMDMSITDLLRYDYSLTNFQRILDITPLPIRMYLRAFLRSGWGIYEPYAEFKRQGVPGSGWRLTHANKSYDLCRTYPAILAVPESISDATLQESAVFRSKGRIPTLVWRSHANNCTISRCSQPMVGISQTRSTADEELVRAIHATSAATGCDKDSIQAPFIVIDARPQINAQANQMAGKGYENAKAYGNMVVQWMDMDNIHVVRDSMEGMEQASNNKKGYFVALDNCGWLKHIRRMLIASLKIVQLVAIDQKSVLVHCSDGWDRTPQLTSLSMLMLDPYYRTLEGFIVLIEKEWISYGHKFADRQGWSIAGHKDEEKSPIFIQWLDCVHQCLYQHPNDFEFNSDLLLFIARYVSCGWYGTFMLNCERDRVVCQVRFYSLSMWNSVMSRQSEYINLNYKPNYGLSCPVTLKPRLVVWDDYFCGFDSNLHKAAWLSNYEGERLLEEDEDDFSVTTRDRNGTADDLVAPLAAIGRVAATGGGIIKGLFGGDTTPHNARGSTESMESTGRGKNANSSSDKSTKDRRFSNWADDKGVNACSRCSVGFSAFKRKHHCRGCGLIFCGPCSSKRQLLASHSKWREVRVCDECFDMKEKEKEKDDGGGKNEKPRNDIPGDGGDDGDYTGTEGAEYKPKGSRKSTSKRQSRRMSATGRERLSLQQISAMSSVKKVAADGTFDGFDGDESSGSSSGGSFSDEESGTDQSSDEDNRFGYLVDRA
jgi:myotubularin-related protein 1/2